MKKYIGIGVLAFVLIGFTACKTKKTADKVGQVELPTEMIDNDWNKALALSKEKGKPIYIEFYAKWCGYCKKFKQNTLNDEEVKTYLSKNYIPIVIDAEEGQGIELKKKYNVNGYPTHVAVDTELNQKAVTYGYLKSDQFLQWIKGVK